MGVREGVRVEVREGVRVGVGVGVEGGERFERRGMEESMTEEGWWKEATEEERLTFEMVETFERLEKEGEEKGLLLLCWRGVAIWKRPQSRREDDEEVDEEVDGRVEDVEDGWVEDGWVEVERRKEEGGGAMKGWMAR